MRADASPTVPSTLARTTNNAEKAPHEISGMPRHRIHKQASSTAATVCMGSRNASSPIRARQRAVVVSSRETREGRSALIWVGTG
ncbi:hypothetical protein D3C86_1680000 [compost metagenome]